MRYHRAVDKAELALPICPFVSYRRRTPEPSIVIQTMVDGSEMIVVSALGRTSMFKYTRDHLEVVELPNEIPT